MPRMGTAKAAQYAPDPQACSKSFQYAVMKTLT
jgi:hypothetical protein